MEALGLILLELLASDVWQRVRERLAAAPPTWAETVSSRTASDTDLGLTTSESVAVASWLERCEVVRVLLASDGDIEATSRLLVDPLAHELGPPSDTTRSRAAEIVATITRHLTKLVAPDVAATLVAFAEQKGASEDLKAGQAAIYDRLEELGERIETVGSATASTSVAGFLDALPSNVCSLVEQMDEVLQRRVSNWFGPDPAGHASRGRSLIDAPPSWAEASTFELFEAVGLLASAHGDHSTAAVAFDHAVNLDPEHRPRLLVHQALAVANEGDMDAAGELLNRSDELLTERLPFSEFTRHALANDGDALAALADQINQPGPQERALVTSWVGQALLGLGRVDEAVAILEPASRAWPAHGGLLGTYAQALLVRAGGERAARRVDDAQAALVIASAARSERRRWGGDSRDPTALACQAAFILGDYATVVRLGSADPGEATIEEASHPDVRTVVALAQLAADDTTPQPTTDFEREWFAGLACGQDVALRDRALEHFERAIEHASSELQLEQAHRQIAGLGKLSDQRLDELGEDRGLGLRGLALLRSGNAAEAITLLRPIANRDRFASNVLAEALVSADRSAEAAEHLERSAERFSEPGFLVSAVEVLVRKDLVAEAFALISRRIDGIPAISPHRCELRLMAVELAARLNDADAVVRASTAALREDCGDHRLRWAKTEALTRLAQFSDAWRELREPTRLEVETEGQAVLFLNVHARTPPSALADALSVMDLFPESEHVVGIGLALFFGLQRDQPPTEDELQCLHEHADRFFELHPESSILKRLTIPTDPNELRDFLDELLRPSEEQLQAQKEILEAFFASRIPTAALAELVGRSYLDIAVFGDRIPFPISFADPTVHEQMVSTAGETLNGELVVDLSSFAVLCHLRGLWERLSASYSRITMPLSAVHLVDHAFRSPPSSGHFGWDTQDDTWTITDLSDEEVSAIESHVDWIQSKVADLDAESPSTGPMLGEFEQLDSELHWLDSLRLAAARQAPLLCDDAALSAIARSLDIPVFNTLAFVEAGDVSAQDGETVASTAERLLDLCAVDLPLPTGDLVDLARHRGWPAGPTQVLLTRTATWADPVQALRTLDAIFEETKNRDVTFAAGIVLAACTGLARSLGAGNKRGVLALVFVSALVQRGFRPDDVPALLAASRAASIDRELGDPLVECGHALWECLDGVMSPAVAGRFILDLMADIDPSDRQRVLTEVVLANR